jgi:hypothetical protein
MDCRPTGSCACPTLRTDSGLPVRTKPLARQTRVLSLIAEVEGAESFCMRLSCCGKMRRSCRSAVAWEFRSISLGLQSPNPFGLSALQLKTHSIRVCRNRQRLPSDGSIRTAPLHFSSQIAQPLLRSSSDTVLTSLGHLTGQSLPPRPDHEIRDAGPAQSAWPVRPSGEIHFQVARKRGSLGLVRLALVLHP